MFAITIGTCPNCGSRTHMEYGSIGRHQMDACPSCMYLYSEDGQTTTALSGRVLEWQGVKRFYGVKTFEELRAALIDGAKEYGFYDEQAWSFSKDDDNSGYFKLGGLKASVSYGLGRLKCIEDENRFIKMRDLKEANEPSKESAPPRRVVDSDVF